MVKNRQSVLGLSLVLLPQLLLSLLISFFQGYERLSRRVSVFVSRGAQSSTELRDGVLSLRLEAPKSVLLVNLLLSGHCQ